MAKPIGLTDEEVAAQEAPVKGLTDEEVAAQVDDQVKGPAQSTGQDEATKNAYAKEKALETALTFFGNGGPTAALRGADAAMKWPAAASGMRPDEGPMDLYRRIRDETKGTMRTAERHGPQVELNVPLAGSVKFNPVALAGAAAPSLIAPNPTGVIGRLGLGGFLGAQGAATQSDADLTKGEFVPFAKDVGKGALFGLGATGAAEGLTAPMRLINRGAASRIGDVVAGKATQDAEKVAEEVRSLQAKARSETQVGSRYSENTLRAANAGAAPMGQSLLGPATQGRAIGTLADPEFKALMESVANNTMDEVPDQVRRIAAAKAAATTAAQNAPAEAAKRTEDFFAKPTITTDVLPRVGRQLQNMATSSAMALPAVAAAGAGFGKMGALGALGLAATQGLQKGALSSARTTLANPRLQAGALEGLIQASQASQKALQAGARSSAADEPKLAKEQEDSVQAFLSGG